MWVLRPNFRALFVLPGIWIPWENQELDLSARSVTDRDPLVTAQSQTDSKNCIWTCTNSQNSLKDQNQTVLEHQVKKNHVIIWGFVQDEVSFLFKNRFSGDACARQKQPFESKVEILLTNKLPDKFKKKKKKHHPGQVSSLSSPSCVWSNYTHDCLSPVSWRGKGAAGHSDPQHLYCLTFRSDDVKGFIRFVPDDKWRRHPRSVHMSLERCMQLSAH